ncbi:hypothetical protein PMAYCL1PPCAC_13648, partial [Pristionchus mayeri]
YQSARMSRLSLFVLLSLLPTVLSLECWAGSQKDDKGTNFTMRTCTLPPDYCIKESGPTTGGSTMVTKGCDPGYCKKTGCTSDSGMMICCCKGDGCNGSPGASLLM